MKKKKLYKFFVDVAEIELIEPTTVFTCWAESKWHAVEQAQNAYEGCLILSTYRLGEEYEKRK